MRLSGGVARPAECRFPAGARRALRGAATASRRGGTGCAGPARAGCRSWRRPLRTVAWVGSTLIALPCAPRRRPRSGHGRVRRMGSRGDGLALGIGQLGRLDRGVDRGRGGPGHRGEHHHGDARQAEQADDGVNRVVDPRAVRLIRMPTTWTSWRPKSTTPNARARNALGSACANRPLDGTMTALTPNPTTSLIAATPERRGIEQGRARAPPARARRAAGPGAVDGRGRDSRPTTRAPMT